MNQAKLALMGISELARLIKSKRASPTDIVKATLYRIELLDKKLNSYITVMSEAALDSAQKAEGEMQTGSYRGPLHGIPVSLKDLFATKGVRTTAGSKILANFIPQEDCTVVRRLREAGAIIIGKTNMHEFALGVTNENPHYGPARNPWDLERIPGGSSGGSAAAVAACLCAGSMGSDTGGSIRGPASLCGIVGLKPTYGLVSRAGVVPLAWSLDHVGPMARTVEDVALMLQAVAGWDPDDPASARMPVTDFRRELRKGIRGLRLGVLKEGFSQSLEPDISDAFGQAIEVLSKLGANIIEVSLPRIDYAPIALMTIVSAEAGLVHEEWLRTRPQDYGADVRARLELGQLMLACHYLRAQRVRSLIRNDFLEALKSVDALVMPTYFKTAPKIGEQSEAGIIIRTGRYTSPINLAGLPAITLPCGFSKSGLPMGLQIVGRPFEERTVLRAAWAYEANTEWHLRRPPLEQ